MTITFMYVHENGDEEELTVPSRKEVCPRCGGKGRHVNPAIDGNGICQAERDDWADDDFMEDYLAGAYDVTCEECDGNNVVDVPDENHPNYAKWLETEDEKAAYAAEVAAERRMGA